PPNFGIGVIPITSVARTREEALQYVDGPALVEYANKHRWIDKPSKGSFETPDDLDGLLLAGTPDDIIPLVRQYAARGATDLVFDFRQAMHRFLEQIDLIGKAVLP